MVASTYFTPYSHMNPQITCQHSSSDVAWGPQSFTQNIHECMVSPDLGAVLLEKGTREGSNMFAVWMWDQSTGAKKEPYRSTCWTQNGIVTAILQVQVHSLLEVIQNFISYENTLANHQAVSGETQQRKDVFIILLIQPFLHWVNRPKWSGWNFLRGWNNLLMLNCPVVQRKLHSHKTI